MYRRTLQHLVKRSNSTILSPLLARFESTQVSKVSEPLRILFCGSDDFSGASLRALHDEQQRDPTAIESIDVLCRPGKRAGRSLKTVREVPVKAVALQLGLPLHERDTFTGWDLPAPGGKPINLIIAVSFGLFVPRRILKSVRYGGLNVHPSLLPNFRGPAPLQHTIMTGTKVTGVTLQTLDENSFDHGIILAQTKPNGLPVSPEWTHAQLLEFIMPKAAEILVEGLRDKLHVPPLVNAGWYSSKKLLPAPKITVADRQIDWRRMTAHKLDSYNRALGRLWNYVCVDKESDRRFIYEDVELVSEPQTMTSASLESVINGQADPALRFLVYRGLGGVRSAVIYVEDGDGAIILRTHNSRGEFGATAIRVKEITMEGKSKHPAGIVMRSIKDKEIWRLNQQAGSMTGTVEPRKFGKLRYRLRKVLAVPAGIKALQLDSETKWIRSLQMTKRPLRMPTEPMDP